MPEENPPSEPPADLEQQLDALLEKMDSDAASADGPRRDDDDTALANRLIDHQVDEAIDAAESGDDADQVDELAGDFEAPDQKLIDAAAALNAGEQPEAPPASREEVSIGQVDAMLAELADGTTEDDPPVAIEPSPLSPTPPTDADEFDGGFAAPDQVLDDLGGSFTAPDELLDNSKPAAPVIEAPPAPVTAPAPAVAFNADADAVAQELDDQPVAESAPTPRAADVPDALPVSRRPLDKVGAIEPMLRRLCAAMNRPLGLVSPELRNTVGYIGLLTLGNALFLLLFALLF